MLLFRYAINIHGEDDSQWFELLVRKLLRTSPNVAIIAISSFRLANPQGGVSCLSEQHICETFANDDPRSRSRGSQSSSRASAAGRNGHGGSVHNDSITLAAAARATDFLRQPSDAERSIERVSTHYGIPHVSLRKALQDEFGTLPYVPSNAFKDCAHPNPQGHSWLAQLVVHAVRQAAAAAAAVASSSVAGGFSV